MSPTLADHCRQHVPRGIFFGVGTTATATFLRWHFPAVGDAAANGMGALLCLAVCTAYDRWKKSTLKPAPCPAGPICITIPRAGGYNVLTPAALGATGATQASAELLNSVPEEAMVTVRVKAAGVNYADIGIRWGLYASWNKFGGGEARFSDDLGKKVGNIPGFDFAGTVEAVGVAAAQAGFKVGDEVFGVTLFGAYSSRIKVSKDYLRKRPLALRAEAAAGLPTIALTAHYAVDQLAGKIAPGSNVLIHSAAGGVGSMLVQMCKLKGWRVCGVVGSAHKVEPCKALGADCVVDKSQPAGLWGPADTFAPAGFGVVFDANGVATFQGSWDRLAPGGKLIVYGFHSMLPKHGGLLGVYEWLSIVYNYFRTPSFSPMNMVSENRAVLGFNLSFLFKRQDLFEHAMDEILGWIAEEKLVLPLTTTYPLAQVAAAHAALESGQTVGKLVLLPP